MLEKYPTEGNPPKFERIIKRIEEVPPSLEKKEEVLRFSPEEKAEQLWACWNEYRRRKYETLLEEKQKPRTERKKLKEAEESPELLRLKNKIAEVWQDKAAQSLFKRNLRENLKEREKISPDLEIFHQKEKELEKTKKEYETLLKDLFGRRGEELDELTQIRIAELSIKIDILRNSLNEVFEKNPELAAFVQYERIKNYHRQFEKDGFIWVPSREKLFEEILNHLVLLNKNRPMLLVGETGTGKTRLVRAAVERLTGRPPFEIGEEAKTDIRPLLGSAWIEKGKTYIIYGLLGQAITGKKNSLEEESDGGGIFYMDEMNGYPADALRSLIKQVSGRAPGEEVAFGAWRGIREKIAEKSGLIGAANLPDEERGRHLDRSSLPVELVRELTTLEVDYPSQIELYEMMLAALMDKNGRIRLKEGEIETAWQVVVDPKTKEKTKILDIDPKSGDTLWRFAKLVSEIQKSYRGEENILTPVKRDVSYLESTVLDPGVVLSWLREYRVSRLRKGEEFKKFLQDKLEKWANQKTYPKEDRTLLREFFTAYALPIEGPEVKKSDVKGAKIWSEEEIGFLSPRVPRPKEKIEKPRPVSKIAFLEDGAEIEYLPFDKPKEINGRVIQGKTVDGRFILEDKETNITILATEKELEKIQKKVYISTLEKYLEEVLKKGKEKLEKSLSELINELTRNIEPKKQSNYLKEIEKELERLPTPQEKIKCILSKF